MRRTGQGHHLHPRSNGGRSDEAAVLVFLPNRFGIRRVIEVDVDYRLAEAGSTGQMPLAVHIRTVEEDDKAIDPV